MDTGTKNGRRWSKVVLPLIAVTAAAVFALIWAPGRLPVTPNVQSGEEYEGIAELWNVESFEGGTGSRESWLKARAARFEKEHKGFFVHVSTLTAEQAEEKLRQGEGFDMVCFSRGVGESLADKLAQVESGADIRDNFLVSGQIGGVQYALPLYTGVYCLFARASMLSEDRLREEALTRTYTRKVGKTEVTLAPLVCGFAPYGSPLSAPAMSGMRGSVQADENMTQYAAYEAFVANRTAVTLLGTQRDMFRLGQRERDGRLESLAFQPLGGYTDLVQYVGISAETGYADACAAFTDQLLSDEAQSALAQLCLFSVTSNHIYTEGRFADSEALLGEAYVPNVFGGSDAVARQRRIALETLAA